MNEVEQIKQLLQQCDEQQRREILDYLRTLNPIHPLEKQLNTSAEVILEAISRASDLTLRGIRGVIAEASFEINVLKTLVNWNITPLKGDFPYDFLITDTEGSVRIQVKMQRRVQHKPLIKDEMYVVETQRTRGGIDKKTGENTRPYRFGEFDILAVSLHPSTNDWSAFIYIVAKRLAPRPEKENSHLLKVMQAVPLLPNGHWTTNLEECISWFRSNQDKPSDPASDS